MPKLTEEQIHKPVLVEEVLRGLDLENIAHLKKPRKYIDATLGHGGYALEIMKYKVELLGIDIDKEVIKVAKSRLEKACPPTFKGNERRPFKLVLGNFKDIDLIARENGFELVSGIIFDLGVSSYQLTSPERGFSFSNPNALLDMRLDKDGLKLTASDLLNILRRDQLEELFSVVLTTKEAKQLSNLVVQQRRFGKFSLVGDFLRVINKVFKKDAKLHPATKAFLALRIAVNCELDNLKVALPKAFELLEPGGKLLVISFHSAEDRIVKNVFKNLVLSGKGELVNVKPITPQDSEIVSNPRCRSSKLRIIKKIK
jgi:16S rRNA (cytosine1402-N4)-methyltransferase